MTDRGRRDGLAVPADSAMPAIASAKASRAPILGAQVEFGTGAAGVPAGVDVSVATDAGDLTARDLDGALDLNSDAGDMTLSGLSGEIVAYTDAGDIDASDLNSGSVDVTSDAGDLDLDFQQAPDTVSAQTADGDIVILLPEQRGSNGDPISYLVEAVTDAGIVDIDVAQDSAGSRTVTAFSGAGDVRIGYRGGLPND